MGSEKKFHTAYEYIRFLSDNLIKIICKDHVANIEICKSEGGGEKRLNV